MSKTLVSSFIVFGLASISSAHVLENFTKYSCAYRYPEGTRSIDFTRENKILVESDGSVFKLVERSSKKGEAYTRKNILVFFNPFSDVVVTSAVVYLDGNLEIDKKYEGICIPNLKKSER